MDSPSPVRDALLVAVLAAATTIAAVVIAEFVTDLIAARRGGELARQSAEYLAVRDATTEYLDRLADLARKEPHA